MMPKSDNAKRSRPARNDSASHMPAPGAIALCLSGGGFRATLFHLGVVRCLHELELLSRVTQIYSVSGGSIIAGHLVRNWNAYTGKSWQFEAASYKLIDLAREDVRGRLIRRWLVAGWLPKYRRIEQLRARYAELYGGDVVDVSKDGAPALHVATTSLNSGRLCWFMPRAFCTLEDDGATVRRVECAMPLATAVCASSAFPALFPPLKVDGETLGAKKFDRVDWLTDGGVFDNRGTAALRVMLADDPGAIRTVLISDASAAFDYTNASRWRLIPSGLRAGAIALERAAALEAELTTAAGVDQLRIGIRDIVTGEPWMQPTHRQNVGDIRTDLDAFSEAEIRGLVWHGYEVTYHQLKESMFWRLPRVVLQASAAKLKRDARGQLWDPCPPDRIQSESDDLARSGKTIVERAKQLTSEFLPQHVQVAADAENVNEERSRSAKRRIGLWSATDLGWSLALVFLASAPVIVATGIYWWLQR